MLEQGAAGHDSSECPGTKPKSNKEQTPVPPSWDDDPQTLNLLRDGCARGRGLHEYGHELFVERMRPQINNLPTSVSYGFRNKKFGLNKKFRLTAQPENLLWITVSTFLSPCMPFRETGFRNAIPSLADRPMNWSSISPLCG